MSNCIFCRIATYEIPGNIVYDDENVIAFRDLHPQAPIHILIIPKQHIAFVNDVEPGHATALAALFMAAKEIAASEGVSEKGYRLVMNTGSDAGQTVSHIHLHFLAGRSMSWPPG